VESTLHRDSQSPRLLLAALSLAGVRHHRCNSRSLRVAGTQVNIPTLVDFLVSSHSARTLEDETIPVRYHHGSHQRASTPNPESVMSAEAKQTKVALDRNVLNPSILTAHCSLDYGKYKVRGSVPSPGSRHARPLPRPLAVRIRQPIPYAYATISFKEPMCRNPLHGQDYPEARC
jgi:hypothetical protein